MSVSLFFASQTVLAPMQLFLFVSNAIFAYWINKEIFRWLGWDGLALLLVVVGVTMSIVSAPKHTESYNNDELMWLMRQPGFIAFCCFAGAFIMGPGTPRDGFWNPAGTILEPFNAVGSVPYST